MGIELKPINFMHTDAKQLSRHRSISDVEGELVIDEECLGGLKDIEPGQRIVMIFNFHRSSEFTPRSLRQTSSHRERGVFSICSLFTTL